MCGVVAVVGDVEAANLTYLGLHALQHRGQESAGIVASDGEELSRHRTMGLVGKGFGEKELARLKGTRAIGHVLYSTSGHAVIGNAQPLTARCRGQEVALAHNGNLTNHLALRRELEQVGAIFQTNSDTEDIMHLIARSDGATFPERLVQALKQVEGAYSLVAMTTSCTIAIRDPHGFRPLCLGRGENGAWLVSSEPSSFELMAARYVRDVMPGEMVVFEGNQMTSSRPFDSLGEKPVARPCIFEYVYFARPDALLDGVQVYDLRKACGRRLIDEHPVQGAAREDTVVVPVPDSGVPAAIGLANYSGLPFEMGLIRSHYVGRTFIEPSQSIRHFGVRLKLQPNESALRGKRVIVVDDSIVRGTTSRKLVAMLRGAGAKEVHVRISSPPTMWPCFYGINTPSRRELIASQHSVEEIQAFLEADSLGYLSLAGLRAAVGEQAVAEGAKHCDACFSGDYPVPLRDKAGRALSAPA